MAPVRGEEVFERDGTASRLRILLLYRQNGFIEAQVDTVVTRTASDASIRFLVYEGEPVRIEYITLSGAEDVIPNRELQRGVPLRVG